jgi:hypothetical protein
VRIFPTALAEKQISALRGPHRKAMDTFLSDLRDRGCAAPGYRLTGEDPVDRICVKHLRGSMRAVVVFEETDLAWLLMVGPHDTGNPDADVYTALWNACGLTAPPGGERDKPSCCTSDGNVPLSGEIEALASLVERCTDLARTSRRRA